MANREKIVYFSDLKDYKDVLEFESRSSFPENGEPGKIYISKDDNMMYRWSEDDEEYVEISSSAASTVTSVNGKRGDVVLTAGDIGYDDGGSGEDTVKSVLDDTYRKDEVNALVQSNSAHYRGFYATWSDVPSDASLYPEDDDGNRVPGPNDYMAVGDMSDYPSGGDSSDSSSPEGDEYSGAWRMTYSGSWSDNGKYGWHPAFQYNESPLTPEQQSALNSGITSAKVEKLDALPNAEELAPVEPSTDPTDEGKPADAKATGDALAGKRDYDDLSYKRKDPSEGGWILHMDGSDVRLLPAGEITWTDTGSETDWTYNLKWLGQWHLAYVAGSGLATCVDQESQEDATELTLVSTSDYETVVATATAASVDDTLALSSDVAKKQDSLTAAQLAAANSGATDEKVETWDGYAAKIAAKASAADLRYRIAEAELTAKLPTGVTLAKDGVAVDHEFYVYSDHISISPPEIEKEIFSWDLDGTNGRDGADYVYDSLVLMQNGATVQPSSVELTVFRALADRTVNIVTATDETIIDIELPAVQTGYSRDFYLAVTCGSAAPTLNAPSGVTLVNANGEPPDLSLSADATTVLKFTEVDEAVSDPASPAVFCVTGGANGGGSLDLSVLVEEFSEQETYEEGDIVQYQGDLYVCALGIDTPGPWDAVDWSDASPVIPVLLSMIRSKADSSALDSKAESEALAPAWISGHAYFKGDHVSYNGLLYECLSTVAGTTNPSADTTHWKLTDLAAPDATLDILSDGRLRVVSSDGTPMWTQGYALASESAVTLSCEKSNYHSFSAPTAFDSTKAYAVGDQVTYTENDVTKVYQFNTAHAAGAWIGTDADEAPIRQKFALPKAPSGVVGDFVLDVENAAAFEAEVVLDGVLGTDYDMIVEKGRALADVLSIPAAADGVSALVELYFTMTAFGTAAKPAWRVVRLNVEKQEVGS